MSEEKQLREQNTIRPITEMTEAELCGFVRRLCEIAEEKAGDCYLGGIYPSNILIGKNGEISIGEGKESGWSGEELRFIAPELYWNGRRCPASDVYSLGLVLYYGITGGCLPFDEYGDSPEQRRMSGESFEAPVAASAALGSIILKATAFHVTGRYQTLTELRNALGVMLGVEEPLPPPEPVKPPEPEEVRIWGAPGSDPIVTKQYPQDDYLNPIGLDSPGVSPAVVYTNNLEKEKRLQKELKRRRRRPVIVIVILCALLLIGAAVYNQLMASGLLRIELGSHRLNEPTATEAPVPDNVLPVVVNENSADAEPAAETSEEAAAAAEDPSSDSGTAAEVNIGEETTAEAEEEKEYPEVRESAYSIYIENVSWTAAKQKCEELGGHLVVINDEAEFNRVTSIAEANGVTYVWIGCSRVDGELTWVTGEEVDFYRWGSGEPSGYDSGDHVAEDYVLLWKPGNSWAYNDSRNNPAAAYPQMYSGKIAYICEFN